MPRPVDALDRPGEVHVLRRVHHAASCLAEHRNDAYVRIMPIDYDRSPVADCGYTGWVQFDDGEIYVVNYIVDDAPKGQIRGYSFREQDVVFPAHDR